MNGTSGRFALVVHGGAGVIEREDMSAEDERDILASLEDALDGLDIEPPPNAHEMRIALCRVQALDPFGVGARDVRPSGTAGPGRGSSVSSVATSLDVVAQLAVLQDLLKQ